MILTINDDGKEKKISYVVPSVMKFDSDVREYIQSYNENNPDKRWYRISAVPLKPAGW